MVHSTRRRTPTGPIDGRRPGAPRTARILVADDDLDTRSVVAAVLRHEGFDVIEAGSGAELLDHLGTSLMFEEPFARPDVVLSDICMPGFTGPEVLAALRDADSTTPVFLMTGLDEPSVAVDAARIGAAGVFHKPLDVDEIVAAVRGALAGAGGATS
jgi:DNA-binding response OmpR family regulator